MNDYAAPESHRNLAENEYSNNVEALYPQGKQNALKSYQTLGLES